MLPLLDKLPERVPAEFPIHIGGMSGNVDALINLSMYVACRAAVLLCCPGCLRPLAGEHAAPPWGLL